MIPILLAKLLGALASEVILEQQIALFIGLKLDAVDASSAFNDRKRKSSASSAANRSEAFSKL